MATASLSVRPSRVQEAQRAAIFSASTRSAKGARQVARKPNEARREHRRIPGGSPHRASFTSSIPALPQEERAAAWTKTQHAQQLQNLTPSLPADVQEMAEETPEMMADPGFAPAQEDFEAEARAGLLASISNPISGAAQINQARAKLAKRAEQIQKAIKYAKKIKDQLFRAYRYGSEVEFEHAAGGSFFWPANFGTVYVSLKTLISPKAAVRTAMGKSDPDEGQFLKGYLSFIEPDVLDVKEQSAWIDFLATGIILLAAWHIFIQINLSFILIGFLALLADTFGEFIGLDLFSFM